VIHGSFTTRLPATATNQRCRHGYRLRHRGRTSLSLTAIFFAIGLLLLPFAREGRGRLSSE
jgi:hypothetical protein